MPKGGVIMDVVTAMQAKIAEDAGAVAVMALERVAESAATTTRRAAANAFVSLCADAPTVVAADERASGAPIPSCDKIH
jgi:pyridoxal biosynthesis lyase PdxS